MLVLVHRPNELAAEMIRSRCANGRGRDLAAVV